MARISFDIPDEVLPRFIDAEANKFGYKVLINGEPNPEPKAAFVRRMQIEEYVRDIERFEGKGSAEVAKQQAIARVRAEITIT